MQLASCLTQWWTSQGETARGVSDIIIQSSGSYLNYNQERFLLASGRGDATLSLLWGSRGSGLQPHSILGAVLSLKWEGLMWEDIIIFRSLDTKYLYTPNVLDLECDLSGYPCLGWDASFCVGWHCLSVCEPKLPIGSYELIKHRSLHFVNPESHIALLFWKQGRESWWGIIGRM